MDFLIEYVGLWLEKRRKRFRAFQLGVRIVFGLFLLLILTGLFNYFRSWTIIQSSPITHGHIRQGVEKGKNSDREISSAYPESSQGNTKRYVLFNQQKHEKRKFSVIDETHAKFCEIRKDQAKNGERREISPR